MSRSTPRHNRAHVMAGTALIAVFVLALAGCPGSEYDMGHDASGALSATRPECPTSWDSIPIYVDSGMKRSPTTRIITTSAGPVYTPPGGQIPGSGPITDIPEFHDCQRFLTADGSRFDSLFAIFAAFGLDSVVEFHQLSWTSSNAAVATVTSNGLITGMAPGIATITVASIADPSVKASVNLTIMPPPGTMDTLVLVPSAQESHSLGVGGTLRLIAQWGKVKKTYRAAATIYSYGPGYTQLAIKSNFNCLYLTFNEAGALQALMVPVPNLAAYVNACLDADPDTLHGTPLAVRRTAEGPDDMYPPVARWDWDPVNRQQYIGIKCGDGWCEVGNKGPNGPLHPSAIYDVEPAMSADEARVVHVKGWYDEQMLAVPDGSGTLHPKLRGTVIPDPRLGARDSADFAKGWVPTAYVALDPAGDVESLKYYKKKFNLDPIPVTTPLDRMNQLQLCFGTREHCGVTAQGTAGAPNCGPDKVFIWPVSRWWVKTTSVTKQIRFGCITRRGHPNFTQPIPGTTRWRWILGDDTIWQACTQGCCEVES